MEAFEDVCAQAGACALSGAALFFVGIPKTAVVINSPLWCYFHILKQLADQPEKSQRIFCTNLDSKAMIYGTEENLSDTLAMVKRERPDEIETLCIIGNCSAALIGDDTQAIARSAGFACPIICLECGGLQGDCRYGYHAAAAAYLCHIPLVEGLPKRKKSINLLGCGLMARNGSVDRREIAMLLESMGYEVMVSLGDEDKGAPCRMLQAELNVVIDEGAGLGMAQELARRYQMPYLNLPLPYGIRGTAKWLRRILQWFQDETQECFLRENVTLYQSQADNLLQRFRGLWGELRFPCVIVAGSVSMAVPLLATICDEWADCLEGYALLHDGLTESALIDNHDVVINGRIESEQIKKLFAQMEEGLLLGSSNEHMLLMQSGIDSYVYQNVSLPNLDEINLTARPYVGFRGALTLLENIFNRYIAMRQHGREKPPSKGEEK